VLNSEPLDMEPGGTKLVLISPVEELKPFLDYHTILLDNSVTDEALCIVPQLRFLTRGNFIRFGHILL
jgi:hypothetical protein